MKEPFRQRGLEKKSVEEGGFGTGRRMGLKYLFWKLENRKRTQPGDKNSEHKKNVGLLVLPPPSPPPSPP